MKKIFLLLIISLCASVLHAQNTVSISRISKYVGYKYLGSADDKNLPDGLKTFGGALITDPFKPNVWGIALVGKGKMRMLWLEREYARTPDKQFPKWQVKDILQFSDLHNDDEILFNGNCVRNKKTLVRTMILATFSKSKKYSVKKAWSANIKLGKFQSISTKGITCELYEP